MEWRAAFWWLLALALFTAEALLPGVFMMWLGFAAAAMALLTLVQPGLGVLVQATLFAGFTFISLCVSARWGCRYGRLSDRPLLHRRAEQIVGQTIVLEQAIVRGRGRVQIADTYWSVKGPDLPAGVVVRVVATDGMTLEVQPH